MTVDSGPPAQRKSVPVPLRLFVELIPTAGTREHQRRPWGSQRALAQSSLSRSVGCPVFLGVFYSIEDQIEAIIWASISEASASAVFGVIFYAVTREVPWLMIESTVVSCVSAGLTFAFQSDLWFKLRGTILPGGAALVALLLLWRKHNILQLALSPYYSNLTQRGWDTLLLKLCYLQLCLAGANEATHRTLDFDAYVSVIRIVNIATGVCFGLFVFGPTVVHYQRVLRVTRPRGSIGKPSVVRVTIQRGAHPRGGAEPPPVVVDLGDPVDLTEEASSPSTDGPGPFQVLAGEAVRVYVTVRTHGPPESVLPLQLSVDSLFNLCIPVHSDATLLKRTGSVRAVAGSASGLLMGHSPQRHDVDYSAVVRVPRVPGLLHGPWLNVLLIIDREDHNMLSWTQSVYVTGRYRSDGEVETTGAHDAGAGDHVDERHGGHPAPHGAPAAAAPAAQLGA